LVTGPFAPFILFIFTFGYRLSKDEASLMNLFFRYIFWRITLTTLSVTFIFLLVFSTLFFLAELRSLENNYQFLNVLLYLLMQAPVNFIEVFPICTFIGSLLGLGNLSINNEITALQVAGVSTRKLLQWTSLTGAFLVFIVTVIGTSFAPQVHLLSKEYRSELVMDLSSSIGEQLWLKDNQNIFRFSKLDQGINIDQATVFNFDSDGVLKSVTELDELRPENDLWAYESSTATFFNNEVINAAYDTNGSVAYLSITKILDSIYVREDLLALPVLYEYMNFFSDNAMNDKRYAYAFWYRIGFFFSVFIMVIAALPFILGSMRIINTGTRLVFGLTSGVSYFIFIKLLLNYGQLYNIDPFAMMMSPHIFLGIAVYCYLFRSTSLSS
jgi:lipopolysaccharide export system permease protein